MSNPYVYRGPVNDERMFFGRNHEIQEIAAFLQGNQSISIIGPRKIGKTSLLFHLMRPATWSRVGLPAEYLFVYLDCEVLGEAPHEDIFAQFASGMISALEERQLAPESALDKVVEKPTRLTFEMAVRRLNQRNVRVVLILDEFERLSTNPHLDVNFFNALRSTASRYQLIFITASASPLIQLTYADKSRGILSSPFFNIFAQQFIGLMPEDEARMLINIPSQSMGTPISEEVGDFIYQLAGGHPYCLQISCFHALESTNGVEVFLEHATREMEANFKYYWRNLSQLEQETLINLTDNVTRITKDKTLAFILRELTHKCLLVPYNGSYRYAFQAWEDFVRTQTDVREQSEANLPLETLSGSRLGPYQVQGLLARGGMAEVYKGVHSRLGRQVAIKVLPRQLASEADFCRRFEREAQAVASLKHPNIVQVFDFGEINNTYYLVMEYVNGRDLTHYLGENEGPIPIKQVLPILQNVASALDYAHEQGVIHRDVKPSNVLLEIMNTNPSDLYTYRAILTDFGIAKLVAGTISYTGMGVMGTVDYMAPEQIQSPRTVDHYADIYALGVLAYRMITGVLPFTGEHPGEVLAGHLHRPAPDPRSFVQDLSSGIPSTLERALSKEPTDRFSTARELVAALAT
jgi:tRNA A-37 threonylcarbamoyl transferase component Bud32